MENSNWKKIITISNIFPEQGLAYQAPFVKNIHQGLMDLAEEDLVIFRRSSASMLPKIFRYIHFFLRILFSLIANKSNLMVFHFPAITCLPVFLMPRKLIKNSLILYIHGFEIYPDKVLPKYVLSLRRLVMTKALWISSAVVVPSVYYRSELLLNYPTVCRSKIIVSPSGGIPDEFYRLVNKCSRQEFSCPHFSFIGRLIESKGVCEAIAAISKLKEMQSCTFNIIGNGPLGAFVKEQVEAGTVDDWVEFGGHEQILNELRRSHCVLFLSRRRGESLGLVALEALAAGVPVIAFMNGAVRDFVVDEENGAVIESLCVSAIVDAMIRVIDTDPNNPLRVRKKVSHTVQGFKAERVRQQLIKDLKEVFQ